MAAAHHLRRGRRIIALCPTSQITDETHRPLQRLLDYEASLLTSLDAGKQ